MQTLRVVVLVMCPLTISGTTRAETIGFQFSGTTLLPSHLFGRSIPVATQYSGHAIYESDSAFTHQLTGCLDCAGYRQTRSNGLFLRVGGMTVRADSYVLSVVNDRPGLSGEPVDLLVFDNHGDWDPPLPSRLYVNGEPVEGGSFRLNLSADSSLLSDNNAPSDPAVDHFAVSLSGVSASTSGGPEQLDFFGLLSALKRFQVIQGDYNQDGIVGPADYTLWSSLFGSDADLAADGNGDGKINAVDYTVWRDNLGSSNALPLPIPEPAADSVALVIFANLALLRRLPQGHLQCQC